MNPSRLFHTATTLALAFLLIFAVPSAVAKGKGGGKKPATPPAPVDTRKVIKSVNAATNSVVIENMRDKTTHTYAIDNVTVVKVNNVDGTIAEIKANMEVTDFVERDNDTLDSISVSGNGEAPSAPAPNKKK